LGVCGCGAGALHDALSISSVAEGEAGVVTIGVDVAGDACAGVRLAGRQPRVALAVIQALDAAVMGLVADLAGGGARVPRRRAGAVGADSHTIAENIIVARRGVISVRAA